MKSLFSFMAIAFIFGFGAVGAQASARFYGQVEYWLEDDAYEEDEEVVNDNAPFYDGTSIEVDPGMGARFGFWLPTSAEGLDLGGSFGYILGPKRTAEFVDLPPFAGTDKYEAETDFMRVLFEIQKRIRTGKAVEIRLRGGIGVGRGHITDKNTSSGVYAPALPEVSDDWTGFTWEISPSVAFGEKGNFELGIMYSAFPVHKGNPDFTKFMWTPFGIRLGYNF